MKQAVENVTAKAVTAELKFQQANPQEDRLFQVVEGVPVCDALMHASSLIDVVKDLAVNIGARTSDNFGIDSEDDPRTIAWAMHYLAENAKAIIDSCESGINHAEQP